MNPYIVYIWFNITIASILKSLELDTQDVELHLVRTNTEDIVVQHACMQGILILFHSQTLLGIYID